MMRTACERNPSDARRHSASWKGQLLAEQSKPFGALWCRSETLIGAGAELSSDGWIDSPARVDNEAAPATANPNNANRVDEGIARSLLPALITTLAYACEG
jgi:hypothetical protein